MMEDPAFRMIGLPQGSRVTLDHLTKHCSWRYKTVKKLLGLTSMSKELMRAMITQAFRDHNIDPSDSKGNEAHYDWFVTITRSLASRGGRKAQKRLQEDPNQTVMRLTSEGSRRKRKSDRNLTKKAGKRKTAKRKAAKKTAKKRKRD